MTIVELAKIPSLADITDVPMDDPMAVFKVCQDLQELCNKENGIGISAVQVGIPWKLFLVRGDGTCPYIEKDKYGYFVNCEYEALTKEERVGSLEGCLSLRSLDGRLRSFRVDRYKIIRIFGYRLFYDLDLKFEAIDYTLEYTQEGIVFQHEIEHHRGILVSDIGKELFVW